MRRLVLAVLALGLVVLSTAVAPSRAFACSCAGISTSRAYAEADAVFTGTVRGVTELGRGDDRRADLRFQVDRVYKGVVYANQLIASPADSAACGLGPEVGSSWTIFATTTVVGRGDSAVTRLRTSLCSGNLPTATPPALLGRGAAPRDGDSDREERAVRNDTRASRALLYGGLGVLGLAAVVGVGLMVLWRPGRPMR